jgi:heme/copper-type cytochrome/quinol oxidase subunit 2
VPGNRFPGRPGGAFPRRPDVPQRLLVVFLVVVLVVVLLVLVLLVVVVLRLVYWEGGHERFERPIRWR